MNNILLTFLGAVYCIIAYYVVIIAHEFGHALVYRSHKGKWPKISFSNKGFSITLDGLDDRQKAGVLLIGIVFGYLTIGLLYNTVWAWHYGLNLMITSFLTIYYTWSCTHDFRLFFRITKRLKPHDN